MPSYPPQQHRMASISSGSQGQLVCNGCRTLLVYPQGAASVRCAVCSVVTAVPAQGTEMAQLVCGGCHTLLMYVRGATNVHCSCCHTVNLAMEANQVSRVSCGGCGTILMYPHGAHSVKCTLCQFITSVTIPRMRTSFQASSPPLTVPSRQSSSVPQPSSRVQTVVVENPMTLNENGKLVSSVVVGVTTEK